MLLSAAVCLLTTNVRVVEATTSVPSCTKPASFLSGRDGQHVNALAGALQEIPAPNGFQTPEFQDDGGWKG